MATISPITRYSKSACGYLCGSGGRRLLIGKAKLPPRAAWRVRWWILSGFHSGAAAPALRRRGIRLGASRQHHRRRYQLARSIVGSLPFAISTDGCRSVPRNGRGLGGEGRRRFSRIRLHRSRIRKRTNAVDDFRLCISPHRGSGTLPTLNAAAQENIARYRSESQKCFAIESVCADATQFVFPDEPIVLFLFNPFPGSGLRKVIANLEQSLRAHPRIVYVLYHNPLLQHVLEESVAFEKICGTHQSSIYASVKDASGS